MAATTAAVTIVPRHVLGRGYTAPSDRLNIAGIGVGGMGRTNLLNLGLDNNLVALCDVDWGHAGPQWTAAAFEGALTREQERLIKAELTAEARKNSEHRVGSLKRILSEDLPKQKRYTDYRLMFEQQKDIDAVVVATPDHTHAAIAMAALDLDKHVYVQKPLCWSVDEARKLARKARQTPKAVTQMGNQGHSWDDGRKAVEWVQSGAIGDVTEVHVWTNRPLSYWPQGIPRPEPRRISNDLRWNMSGVSARLANAMGIYSVPDTLNWDLFLGPAPQVEYHPVYHPFNWRGWVDWGCGALGDMGAHLIDHAYWALDLGYPIVDRDGVDAVRQGVLSHCHEHLLRVPGARREAAGQADVVRRRHVSTDAARVRRGRETQRRRRRDHGRHQGQGDLQHLWPAVAAPAGFARPLGWRSAADAAAHHDQSRGELVERLQGRRPGVVPVRVRGEADRSDAARGGVATGGREDSLRRARTCGSRTRARPTIS